jgi:hypothetical protein
MRRTLAPSPDEAVVERLHGSLVLLRQLQVMEQTPKVEEATRLLRSARARMYERLRALTTKR